MTDPATGESPRERSLWLFAPLAIFAAIVIVGRIGFSLGDRAELPSALLNQPFPEFSAPVLSEPQRIVTRAELVGRVQLVNVWATWCPTCLAEHGELARIAETYGLPIVGINYKDDPVKAAAWLRRYGDPYDFHLIDADGQLGVELGVYGAPESFLLDATGRIVYKRVGDVNPRIWRDELQPRLAQLGFAFAAAGDNP
ncbi:MAG: DsbE family thiol:disulfide interchange protein [Pseudomonadota bacterium]